MYDLHFALTKGPQDPEKIESAIQKGKAFLPPGVGSLEINGQSYQIDPADPERRAKWDASDIQAFYKRLRPGNS